MIKVHETASFLGTTAQTELLLQSENRQQDSNFWRYITFINTIIEPNPVIQQPNSVLLSNLSPQPW